MDRGEVVVVTGKATPVCPLTTNSSNLCQGLKSVGLGEWTVYVQELPVSYVKTQQMVADMWTTINPKFAVHLGLATGSSVVILEQSGKNCPYRDRDVCGFCPESHCCVRGGPDRLDSLVDMRAVFKQFRQAGADVVYSRDAGRYLCDFAYYCSLYHGQRKAALIHVPSRGSLASADRLVPLLQTIIQTMLRQLKDSETARAAAKNTHHATQRAPFHSGQERGRMHRKSRSIGSSLAESSEKTYRCRCECSAAQH